jgi:hypothetical protein
MAAHGEDCHSGEEDSQYHSRYYHYGGAPDVMASLVDHYAPWDWKL